MAKTSNPVLRAISFAAALLAMAGLFFGALSMLNYAWTWQPVLNYREVFWKGWLATLAISGLALPASCLLGLLSALARRSPLPPLRDFSRIFVELTRGTPLLVQIFIYWYVFGQTLSRDFRFTAGALVLALFESAYISEIIRSGIESIGQSQLESARAIGLTNAQTYRYVIFPQAIRQILPALAGQFVNIIKDSSLLSVLGIEEFTLAATQTSSVTTTAFECYLPVAVGYLILTLPISLWTQ
jgi:polar amino acid transport system permease protein